MLLVYANQVVVLDRLIEELWGQQPPAQATASLQAYVSNLRRALEPGRPARAPPRVLVTQPPGYRLVVPSGNLDAARFVALAEQSHRLLEVERPGPAAKGLREALGLWRGPALADVADEPFAQAERQPLEELRLVVLEDRLAAELALGGHAAAAAELHQSRWIRTRSAKVGQVDGSGSGAGRGCRCRLGCLWSAGPRATR